MMVRDFQVIGEEARRQTRIAGRLPVRRLRRRRQRYGHFYPFIEDNQSAWSASKAGKGLSSVTRSLIASRILHAQVVRPQDEAGQPWKRIAFHELDYDSGRPRTQLFKNIGRAECQRIRCQAWKGSAGRKEGITPLWNLPAIYFGADWQKTRKNR
jgi:tryptophan synthase beta subunit